MDSTNDWVDVAGRLLIVGVWIFLALLAAARGLEDPALKDLVGRHLAKAPRTKMERHLDRICRRARSFMARFLADAGMELVPDDVRGMWLSCQAASFRRDAGRDGPGGFVPTERQLKRCLAEYESLVKHAARYPKIFPFAQLDVEGATTIVIGYLLRYAFAGRTLPERPRLVQLMGSALAEWPGMETEGRPMYGNDAYGCHRQVLGLLDGTTDPESQRIIARRRA